MEKVQPTRTKIKDLTAAIVTAVILWAGTSAIIVGSVLTTIV